MHILKFYNEKFNIDSTFILELKYCIYLVKSTIY